VVELLADGRPADCADATSATTRITANTCTSTISRLIGKTAGVVAYQLLTGCARRRTMLETIAVILIILWLLGMVSGYTMGNFIYVLLVVAIVLFLVRLVSGRRVL
jgi:hypothetical protein